MRSASPVGGTVRTALSGNDPIGSHAQVRSHGPTALRIVLGNQLRQLREASGITTGAAGHAIRASHAKISRMELGRVSFKERDVADLLTLYGVTDENDRGAFLALARRANVPGWWHHYADLLPSWFEMYLGLEQASSVIRTYEPQLVPGLLQSPEGARAVIQMGHPHASAEDIERRLALRMKRQKVLLQPGAPSLWAVVDEAALWRLDGRSVMQEQMQHLIDMAELPNITLQVMPFYSGAHAAVGGPFTMLRFAEPDLPDLVYLEQLTSALYLDKSEDVQHYLVVMDRLCVQAKSPTETVRFLTSTLKEA
ncbi:MAG TPA: helix-turn-helix transcriptional regulator [Pseudonocardiaceae bacterium]|nr:helix-turn-helix transcriptional regulator [Pseudonocardiaceae bacterium]